MKSQDLTESVESTSEVCSEAVDLRTEGHGFESCRGQILPLEAIQSKAKRLERSLDLHGAG